MLYSFQNNCALNCLEKYLKMTQRISQRFQEYQIQQTDASTPVKHLTGSWYVNVLAQRNINYVMCTRWSVWCQNIVFLKYMYFLHVLSLYSFITHKAFKSWVFFSILFGSIYFLDPLTQKVTWYTCIAII